LNFSYFFYNFFFSKPNVGKQTHINRQSLNYRKYNSDIMASYNTNAIKKLAMDIAIDVIVAAALVL
ncbi:MAG: hypothetical protein ACFFDK_14755, partial [Promethearchaeota archaeon]